MEMTNQTCKDCVKRSWNMGWIKVDQEDIDGENNHNEDDCLNKDNNKIKEWDKRK